MDIGKAVQGLYPGLIPGIAFLVGDDANGNPTIVQWNNPNPQPSPADYPRGFFLYCQRAAYGRMASGMIDAMRALVPELSGVEGAQQRPEGYVVVLLLEGMANNNPTRINAVKAERTKWGQKRAQVDAVTLSASPTESEYLSKADTLNALTY